MRNGRPNVVLIFVDNQPAKMMGCAGNDEIHTPNLDALASEGARFSEAFCPNAMCSPCRASVLTGLMPSQHGVHTWLDDAVMHTWPEDWNALAEFTTLPEHLKALGYHTSLIGKYHLGIADTARNGFDNWVTMQIGHVLSFHDNAIIDNGRRFTCRDHSVDFFTERAVATIRERARRRAEPFFLFLTYPAPYGFWPAVEGEPTNRHRDRYRDTPFRSVPREAVAKRLVDWVLIRHDMLPDDEPDYFESLVRMPNDLPTLRNYYSQMSVVDEGVGEVLAALEACALGDDTLVVYTSDHGMALGEHGFWGHGEDSWPSHTHREANHIPLIVRLPRHRAPGTATDRLVGTTDIFATILDYAGADPVAPDVSASRSLRPLLEGRGAGWEDVVFMEQEETRSIRTGRWLLMRRFRPTPYDFGDELYDLGNDPDERDNVAGDPAYRAVMTELTARLDRHFDRYSDPKWDLWKGGSVKSNSTRPFLWRAVWGPGWRPTF